MGYYDIAKNLLEFAQRLLGLGRRSRSTAEKSGIR
jgi:hypothetical protein